MSELKTLTTKKMWCYAIGQLGWSIISGLIGSWLVYFYQPNAEAINDGMVTLVPAGRVIFGVLTIVGLITFGGRIFDAVTDPLVGNWSDNCKHKRGRRMPFLLYSAIPLGLVFVLVFWAPVKSISGINVAWLFIFLGLYYFLITCYCTPYTSLLAELTHSQEEKLKLSTCISLTFIVGTAVGYAAPVIWDIFIKAGMERILAMRITFLIMAVIAIACMLVTPLTINEKDYSAAVPSKSNMMSSLAKTFKNKDFRIFVLQDIVYWFGLTMFQTGLPFFVTSLLKFPETMSTPMFVGLTVLSLLYYPFVNMLVKKFGKKKLLVAAFIGFFLTFGFTAICGPALHLNIWVQAVLIVVLGSFPQAIFGIIPQAMVADIAQSDEITTGENRSGMFYAARTFAMKFGQSIAMLAFTSLATIGISREQIAAAERASESVAGTDTGYRVVALVAAVCCILGGLFILFFNEKKIMNIITPASEK